MDNNAKKFNLHQPAHHIANDVMRQLENIAHDSGVEIAFGVKSHNVIARLVQQYQDKLMQGNATDSINNKYQLAYFDLAAQVRRLGILADVQIEEHSSSFGENYDARQVRLAILATVSKLNQLTLEIRSNLNDQDGGA